jgi:phenylpyruvate tautomerase PptA (4-oxalocrotonate tautomerase family)
MPLWTIYHPVAAFEADHKQALAKAITKLYSFPAFYVGVVFIEQDHDSFYRGGEPADNFVRIAVDHINLTWKTREEASRRIKQFDEALAPTMRDRGLVWEFHIDETPRNLWLIEGFPPPPSGSEAEKRWLRENRPSAYATKAVDG